MGAGFVFFLALMGCSSVGNAESNDPYLKNGIRLDIMGISYASRGIEYWVDGNWGGYISAPSMPGHSNGGNASTCCFNLVDYKKPVKVKWKINGTSTGVVDAGNGVYIRGKQLTPDVEKEASIMLPQRLPQTLKTKSGIPETARQDTLCVIFKDVDTVELQYGYVGCDDYEK
ncbi:Uncharacterized protein ChrSV_3362 [Chromobacterium vaccinii]|nr:Uncharacterized protein ChrSW_3362 [Chromobacterium vaccinii]QND90819.1 Uncharacterized protein ChrSV_3362 [Chromobacterium vaccinii]